MVVHLGQGRNPARDGLDAALPGLVRRVVQLLAQHPINQLQIVAHPVLQFFGQDLLLIQQPVLLSDEDFHPLDGVLQNARARRRRDSLGKNIGKTGEEIDVVLVVIVLLVIVDLQHAIGLVIAAFDDDVDGRDDAMLGIK